MGNPELSLVKFTKNMLMANGKRYAIIWGWYVTKGKVMCGVFPLQEMADAWLAGRGFPTVHDYIVYPIDCIQSVTPGAKPAWNAYYYDVITPPKVAA